MKRIDVWWAPTVAGIVAIVFVSTLCGLVLAQDKPDGTSKPAPAATTVPVPAPLTAEQRKDVKLLAQEMEIAQLRFDKARVELSALVQSLQREGFDLDLQSGTYTPKPAPKKPGGWTP